MHLTKFNGEVDSQYWQYMVMTVEDYLFKTVLLTDQGPSCQRLFIKCILQVSVKKCWSTKASCIVLYCYTSVLVRVKQLA